MQPVRQIFENAPNSVPIPEELRRRRVEMILWPLDEEAPKLEPLKSLLSSMPNVGNDEDFMRKSDFGRDMSTWDI